MADHPLQDLMNDIAVSHPGLEGLAAMTVVAIKARKCMLTVGWPGCGKSTVTNWISDQRTDAYVKDSLTRSSLKQYENLWNGFEGVMLFDDLGKVDTDWSRIQTVTTMAEIVHGHFISKDSFQIHIEIDNFFGACVLNIQPNVLHKVVADASWHSNLADKSLRYYHLPRATSPNRNKLENEIDWGIDLKDVGEFDGESPLWDALIALGRTQWTAPRTLEHIHDLLRAVAALGSNPTPGDLEMMILLDLLRPASIEMDVLETVGFGESTSLDIGLLCLLTEFATYPTLTYGDIAQDMKMRERKVEALLGTMVEWFVKSGRDPVRLQPSPELLSILKKAGLR